MANEIYTPQPTGLTLYYTIVNAAGQVYNGSTFETPAAANWANYDLALTDPGSTGQYVANFPALAAGLYRITVYSRAVADPPNPADEIVAAGPFNWDGDSEVVPGAGGGLDAYAKAYLYGKVTVNNDGSFTYVDADNGVTDRLLFERRPSPGGRLVTKDP